MKEVNKIYNDIFKPNINVTLPQVHTHHIHTAMHGFTFLYSSSANRYSFETTTCLENTKKHKILMRTQDNHEKARLVKAFFEKRRHRITFSVGLGIGVVSWLSREILKED